MSDMDLHYRVTIFLNMEADMLDRWALDEWLSLFADDAHYYVPPTDMDGDKADPTRDLFYIMDDRARLRERVVRLNDKNCHSEQPRSKTRHLVSNIIAKRSGEDVDARASFVVYRHKDGAADAFVGHYVYTLEDCGDTFRIKSKKCVLDMEALRPHGRISILL
ncbi:MAG: aromatic-ring-hydroxylating dioxygenase subunit beta [Caulobacterales bacterium]